MSKVQKSLEVFAPEELSRVARETGFCKRVSKMSPSSFFDIMMYDTSSGNINSLNQLAIEAHSEHDIGITKQGIDKRFNDHTVGFLKHLIEMQLSVKLDQQIDAGWLSSFDRVLIKDGTRFNLPEAYQAFLPGSGGSGSKAGACLQMEYDFKSGSITDLCLTPANRPDVTDAQEVMNTVRRNDLVIRDLGYYAFPSLLNISAKGAFYISRLGYTTIVYERVKGKWQRLDFKVLFGYMKQYQLSQIEIDVLIGAKQKIPVRLVVQFMPDTVYEERMRKVQKIAQKKGYQPSKDYKFMARFNLFITNVPRDILPEEVVSQLYKIRWQVELVFKIWKSVIGIHHARNMKFIRWLCLLYFKLLLMLISWNAILVQRGHLYAKSGQILSLNKCFKTLFDNTFRLRAALRKGALGISDFIQWVTKTLNQNHWLEKKNECFGLEKIFYLSYCKSNIYVYI
jgi:hypothetical protein